MIKIGICDDDIAAINILERILEEFFEDKEEKEVISYTRGEDLIDDKKKMDIVFLDIEMPGLDGIQTAEKIREYDKYIPIIYVTSYGDYALQAYSVHPFDFIEKPVNKERVFEALTDWMKMKEEEDNQKIVLETESGIRIFTIEEIYYFIINERKIVTVSTTTGKYSIKESLGEIYKRLDPSRFFVCHRSCLVNVEHIKSINEYDIVMENEEFLPIAQRRKKIFLDFLYKNLQHGRERK